MTFPVIDEKKELEAIHNEQDLLSIPLDELRDYDGLIDAASEAVQREHCLSFRQAVHAYPGAFIWAIIISFTIVMEGYDGYLLGQLYAYPSFAAKYGDYHPSTGKSIISAPWQVGLADCGRVGNLVGLLLMSFFSDRWGHRKVIMFGLLCMVAIIFGLVFAPNVQVLAACIFLMGIPNGLFGILGSAYASEVCPLALRGVLTSYVNLCWIIGQLVASGVLVSLVSSTSVWAYRIPWAIQWVWPPFLFAAAYFAPDSPWWCVRTKRLSLAETSLKRLGGQSTQLELRQMLALMIHTNQVEQEMKAGNQMIDCFRGVNFRRTEIACVTLSLQAIVGQTFAYGSTYFFIQAGFSAGDAYKLSLGSLGLAFICTIVSCVVMTWIGRRTLLLAGLAAIVIDYLIVGCLSYAPGKAPLWIQAGFIVLWLGVYSVTIGPQSFGLAAEISATRLRSQTVAFARFFYQAVAIVAVTIEPYLLNPTAANLKGKTAFVWMATSILALVYTYLRIPETRGITYTELDLLFARKTPAWRFKEVQESGELQLGNAEGEQRGSTRAVTA